MTAQILTAILSAMTTAIMGGIGRMLWGIQRDVKRFMKEHLWLLAMADWSKQSIAGVWDHLNITNGPSPPEWPGKKS